MAVKQGYQGFTGAPLVGHCDQTDRYYVYYEWTDEWSDEYYGWADRYCEWADEYYESINK